MRCNQCFLPGGLYDFADLAALSATDLNSAPVQALTVVGAAPRIYYFDPFLAGPHRSWSVHLSRCRELGFTHVLSAPLFDPEKSGDLFLSSDHERLNSAIAPATGVDLFVTEFARARQDHDLTLLLDVVFPFRSGQYHSNEISQKSQKTITISIT